jgi:hypothetical protein
MVGEKMSKDKETTKIVWVVLAIAIILLASSIAISLLSYSVLEKANKERIKTIVATETKTLTVGSVGPSIRTLEEPKTMVKPILAATKEIRKITVIGTGSVTSKPEIAVISISVVTRANEASEAQRLNANKMNNIIKALKNAGIKEEQIETTGFSLQPIYEYDKPGKKSIIVGYECRNSIKVTMEELDKVGEMADLAVNSGANKISSIVFSLRDETVKNLMLKALEKAVKNAESKAKTIAEAAGVKLIGPVSMNVGEYAPYPRYAEVIVGAVTKEPTPIVAPKELSVTISVSMVYEFTL